MDVWRRCGSEGAGESCGRWAALCRCLGVCLRVVVVGGIVSVCVVGGSAVCVWIAVGRYRALWVVQSCGRWVARWLCVGVCRRGLAEGGSVSVWRCVCVCGRGRQCLYGKVWGALVRYGWCCVCGRVALLELWSVGGAVANYFGCGVSRYVWGAEPTWERVGRGSGFWAWRGCCGAFCASVRFLCCFCEGCVGRCGPLCLRCVCL